MATKLEGGWGVRPIVARPLVEELFFFCGFPNEHWDYTHI